VKQHFHIVFAGALLLGSLIIIHKQKSGHTGNTIEFTPIELSELAAELPIQHINQRSGQPVRHHSCLLDHIFPGNFRNASYPYAASCQMRMKTQMIIYLEQKPDLEFRSGQFLCHPSSYGDPPGFSS
jgi:hypothetical protein